jgi:hypothetical protein
MNYVEIQTTVSELISENGSQYSLSRPSPGGDQTLGVRIYGIFSKQLQDRFSSTGGGVVSMNKKTICLPVIQNGKVEPRVGDRLLQGNSNWRIDSVEVIRPDGVTTILYICDIT